VFHALSKPEPILGLKEAKKSFEAFYEATTRKFTRPILLLSLPLFSPLL
jgi:hypothetical protein